MDLTELVNVCVTDLELTGDPGMAMSSLDAMLSDCQFAALSNASNYGNGTYKPPPELKPCPGDCSGNGDCVHGVCACAPGFEEEDCSIDHRQPPSFTGVAGGGACAINEEECYLPVLVGGNIKPGDTSCYARAMQKGLNGKWTMDTTATENKAEFLSTNHAVCNLPRLELSRGQAMAGFMVSLSNNHGTSSSPERPYYLYNSRCMICHDGNCTIKPDTCVIENTCYDAGDLDLLDNNGACQPLVNNTAWSSDSGASPNAPPSATLNKYTSADVGCFCLFDPSSAECACCQNAGCQCSRAHKHACYDCLHPEMCGQ
ncbi:von Willebrand factor D and EGF domain-containing protein-like [Mya arenaria]|nr:von Willebrand factor D and EGF domain-containing protein-like [Mya arenaria]